MFKGKLVRLKKLFDVAPGLTRGLSLVLSCFFNEPLNILFLFVLIQIGNRKAGCEKIIKGKRMLPDYTSGQVRICPGPPAVNYENKKSVEKAEVICSFNQTETSSDT